MPADTQSDEDLGKKYDNTLISIVTPLYNCAAYIEETARSVLSQTYTRFEWLVVDDCSTDKSVEVLKHTTAGDTRVRLIQLEKNIGPIKARNVALEQARGRFIAFVDSDDVWLPEKLERQIHLMQSRNVPLSYTGYRKICQDSSFKSPFSIPVPGRVSYKSLRASNSIIASSAMLDRNLLGDIYQEEKAPLSKDDLYLWLSILETHPWAEGVQEVLCYFRVRQGSITKNKKKAAKAHWHFYRKFLQMPLFSSMYNYCIYAVKGFLKYIL